MNAAPALLAALETLWKEVLAAPEDDDKHAKFFAFAVQNDLFLPAIERYKAFGAAGGAAAERAAKQQKRIADAAAAKVFAKAPRSQAPARRSTGKLLVVLALATAMVLGLRAWMNIRETLDAGRPSGQTSTR